MDESFPFDTELGYLATHGIPYRFLVETGQARRDHPARRRARVSGPDPHRGARDAQDPRLSPRPHRLPPHPPQRSARPRRVLTWPRRAGPPRRGAFPHPGRQDSPEAVLMVRRQLEGRGITDAPRARGDARVPRHLFVPAGQTVRGLRRLPPSHRSRPDHLAALHGGGDDRGARPAGRRAGAGDRHGQRLPGRDPRGARGRRCAPSSASPSWRRPPAGRWTGWGTRPCSPRTGDGSEGWAEHAPYDAILVAAAAPRVPPALLEQLADNGILVVPVGETPPVAGPGRRAPQRAGCSPVRAGRRLPVRSPGGQGGFEGTRPRRDAAGLIDKALPVAANTLRSAMAVPIFRPTVKRRDMGSVLTCIVSDKLGPGRSPATW